MELSLPQRDLCTAIKNQDNTTGKKKKKKKSRKPGRFTLILDQINGKAGVVGLTVDGSNEFNERKRDQFSVLLMGLSFRGCTSTIHGSLTIEPLSQL